MAASPIPGMSPIIASYPNLFSVNGILYLLSSWLLRESSDRIVCCSAEDTGRLSLSDGLGDVDSILCYLVTCTVSPIVFGWVGLIYYLVDLCRRVVYILFNATDSADSVSVEAVSKSLTESVVSLC